VPQAKADKTKDGRGEDNRKILSSIYNYVVVLSIILITFAAFRNSVTWYVKTTSVCCSDAD
jgi:hypothetical protein